MKSLLIALALVLLSSAVSVEASGKEPKPEVLGISIGMSREAVRRKLARIGRPEKEERKQQEVWSLTGDGPYESVIVGFEKGYTGVRYVTARGTDPVYLSYFSVEKVD